MQASYEIRVDIHKSTPKAILAWDGEKEGWIPKSVITSFEGHDLEDGREDVGIMVQEWFLEKGGWI